MVESVYGFRVATAENIFRVAEESGIRPWEQTEPPCLLEDFLKRELSPETRAQLRFAPKSEVVFLRQPNGKPYLGFRSVGKNWVSIFTLMPDPADPRFGQPYVPVIVEWKHGAEVIELSLPSGVPSPEDGTGAERYRNCAKREFEEESGLKAAKIHELTPHGCAASGRNSTQRAYAFAVELAEPIEPGPKKLDDTEHLICVAMRLSEWMKLIFTGQVHSHSSMTATFLGMPKLGRYMKFAPP